MIATRSLPPTSVVRSDEGCERAWLKLIRDGLMSMVGVLGNIRDNLIEGAVSLVESADRSLLLGGRRAPLGRARGGRWLPGKRRGAASGLAAGALHPYPRSADRAPSGFRGPTTRCLFRYTRLGDPARVQGPRRGRGAFGAGLREGKNRGPRLRGGGEGGGNPAPRGQRMIHGAVAGRYTVLEGLWTEGAAWA